MLTVFTHVFVNKYDTKEFRIKFMGGRGSDFVQVSKISDNEGDEFFYFRPRLSCEIFASFSDAITAVDKENII
jgi:hypothetical protein